MNYYERLSRCRERTRIHFFPAKVTEEAEQRGHLRWQRNKRNAIECLTNLPLIPRHSATTRNWVNETSHSRFGQQIGWHRFWCRGNSIVVICQPDNGPDPCVIKLSNKRGSLCIRQQRVLPLSLSLFISALSCRYREHAELPESEPRKPDFDVCNVRKKNKTVKW